MIWLYLLIAGVSVWLLYMREREDVFSAYYIGRGSKWIDAWYPLPARVCLRRDIVTIQGFFPFWTLPAARRFSIETLDSVEMLTWAQVVSRQRLLRHHAWKKYHAAVVDAYSSHNIRHCLLLSGKDLSGKCFTNEVVVFLPFGKLSRFGIDTPPTRVVEFAKALEEHGFSVDYPVNRAL